MSNFIFGVFVNHANKQFSTTARTKGHPHLSIMVEDEAVKGFEFLILATGLTKQQADAFKAIQIAAFENIGYDKVTRSSSFCMQQ
jgi:hypothetical protein